MRNNPHKPYNELPLLLPKREEIEKISIYKKLPEARAALAELKGRMPIIPDPLMLINTLILQEARDSSIIENINTDEDKLFRAFSSGKKNIDSATKEVLRYRDAMWTAFQELDRIEKLDFSLIENIFRMITQKDEYIREIQVYVGNKFNVTYTPPQPGKTLQKKLDNFVNFFNNDNNYDSLIMMAIFHYQFEAIHPFSDGNGRTGRILNVLYLTKKGLLDLPILYISKFILEYKNEYYRSLREVTEHGNWEQLILFMLEAVKNTAYFTLNKVNAIYELFDETLEKVRARASDIYSYELVNTLFAHLYTKIGILVENNVASRNTASKYLNRLCDLGILESKKEGKENLYLNKKLFEILVTS